MPRPIAVLCSDIHMSLNPPTFRSEEPSWLDAMERSIKEMAAVAAGFKVPVVCAGDVWDRYFQHPEAINWAVRVLDGMPIFSVPGQHDLPYHVNADIRKSAYWTLVETGNLINLTEPTVISDDLKVYPFPWGVDPAPLRLAGGRYIHLAVVHRYIWKDYKSCYPGADEKKRVGGYSDMLKGYDAAVFGDNHIGFQSIISGCEVFNCGTFFIRKSDEIDYKPQIGILYNDATIQPHFLDQSLNKYSVPKTVTKQVETAENIRKFVEDLRAMGQDSLNFRAAVRVRMDQLGTDQETREVVEQCMGVQHVG